MRINEGILAGLVEQATDELPFLILPTQEIGYSAEHEAFPGTLSQQPAALIDSWTSIIGQAAALDFRRFLMFNSHGGNSDLMRITARSYPHKIRVTPVRIEHQKTTEIECRCLPNN